MFLQFVGFKKKKYYLFLYHTSSLQLWFHSLQINYIWSYISYVFRKGHILSALCSTLSSYISNNDSVTILMESG